MKAIALALVFASLGCSDFLGGTSKEQVKALEQRIAVLEKRLEAKADQDNQRHEQMQECLRQANEIYWDHIRRNGQVLKNGSINAPAHIMESARRLKEMKMEECKMLYSK